MVDDTATLDDSDPRLAPRDPVHVSRLGNGGAMLLFALRQWIWCFSAGHHPPACIHLSFSRAGCPKVPTALLSLLRLLRGSDERPLYFHPPAASTLTNTEWLLLRGVAGCKREEGDELRFIGARLAGVEQAEDVSAALRCIGNSLHQAGLRVWSDTLLRVAREREEQHCEFFGSASNGAQYTASPSTC